MYRQGQHAHPGVAQDFISEFFVGRQIGKAWKPRISHHAKLTHEPIPGGVPAREHSAGYCVNLACNASLHRPFRDTAFPAPITLCERRSDGTLILRSAHSLPAIAEKSFADFIPAWAASRGESRAFCERDRDGQWRAVT